MAGVDDLFWLYQNADTAILLAVSLAAYIAWKRDIQPRLMALEDVQERRGEKWDDQKLSGQERDLLLDDAHDRIGRVEDAVARLRERLRRLENGVAAETGFYRGGDAEPDFDFDGRSPDDAPSAQTSAMDEAIDQDRNTGRQQDRSDDRPERGDTLT